MRRMELVHLQMHDLDAERGVVTIRQGKNKKDRVIPIGTRALAWITKYLCDATWPMGERPYEIAYGAFWGF